MISRRTLLASAIGSTLLPSLALAKPEWAPYQSIDWQPVEVKPVKYHWYRNGKLIATTSEPSLQVDGIPPGTQVTLSITDDQDGVHVQGSW